MPKEKKTSPEEEKEQVTCPLCAMLSACEKTMGQHSQFFEHLKKAEVEVLQAVRSLIDERIKAHEKPAKKVTKIKVE